MERARLPREMPWLNEEADCWHCQQPPHGVIGEGGIGSAARRNQAILGIIDKAHRTIADEVAVAVVPETGGHAIADRRNILVEAVHCIVKQNKIIIELSREMSKLDNALCIYISGSQSRKRCENFRLNLSEKIPSRDINLRHPNRFAAILQPDASRRCGVGSAP